MRDCAGSEAMVLADRLRALIEATRFVYSGKEIPVTMSLGVSTFDPQRHQSGADLVEESDQFLYHAKRHGRNRVAGPTQP